MLRCPLKREHFKRKLVFQPIFFQILNASTQRRKSHTSTSTKYLVHWSLDPNFPSFQPNTEATDASNCINKNHANRVWSENMLRYDLLGLVSNPTRIRVQFPESRSSWGNPTPISSSASYLQTKKAPTIHSRGFVINRYPIQEKCQLIQYLLKDFSDKVITIFADFWKVRSQEHNLRQFCTSCIVTMISMKQYVTCLEGTLTVCSFPLRLG